MAHIHVNTVVVVFYASLQVTIAFVVSIIGAFHVRRSMRQSKIKKLQNLQQTSQEVAVETAGVTQQQSHVDNAATANETESTTKSKKDTFLKLWISTVWKMRGVYSGLAVHSFDVLTDILVIIEWISLPDIEGDHIDPKVMAYCAIFVVVFSRLVSSIAIYFKEQNITRCILQLFDLLIFVEIFESHRKVISQIKHKNVKNKQNSIESTFSFKYIRNMEAIFESIPQSVLQLVYVMRTTAIEAIFWISIIQSIISMTNSVLNSDYTRMQQDKWKKHKQRMPPTLQFLKHAISRLSEICYRIGLLALFWTVCGGLAFSVMMVIELVFMILRMMTLIVDERMVLNGDTLLENLNSIIVIPSEYVYGIVGGHWIDYFFAIADNCHEIIFITIANVCCCLGLCAFFSSLSSYILCRYESDSEFVPVTRISVSFAEFMFIIFWALFAEHGERKKFLLDFDYGLYIFIATIVFYVIYTQYMVLFPDFALPFRVGVRSKYGYAFSNELSELKKIKVPLKKMPYKSEYNREYTIEDAASFWDEPVNTKANEPPITAAVFALSKGYDDVVQWLEEQGAVGHHDFDTQSAIIAIPE